MKIAHKLSINNVTAMPLISSFFAFVMSIHFHLLQMVQKIETLPIIGVKPRNPRLFVLDMLVFD